jgi:hypothetical protein
MREECLVPFWAAVIGTPPVGDAATLAACRPAGRMPALPVGQKMSARRHLKYYLKVFAKRLFSESSEI